jgi:methionyl-tRNA formyltransferase
MRQLKVIFMGTAELACASLRALHADESMQVLAAVSQPDKPRGRELALLPTPVKAAALALGIPVLQPRRARDESFIHELRALGPELIVVAAYGQLLPPALLDLPPFGCLNVHTSLLPKYRGAAPIQWAILNGEMETGVTIMKMDPGLDTGPILSESRTMIEDHDNAQTLHDRLAELGAGLLLRTSPAYTSGQIVPKAQPAEGASYARKLTKEDGHLTWSQPAPVLWRQVRGLSPWPGAFTFVEERGQPRLLKVWSAELDSAESTEPGTVLRVDAGGILVACAQGALRLTEVQREGGRRLPAAAFLSGHPMAIGSRLK